MAPHNKRGIRCTPLCAKRVHRWTPCLGFPSSRAAVPLLGGPPCMGQLGDLSAGSGRFGAAPLLRPSHRWAYSVSFALERGVTQRRSCHRQDQPSCPDFAIPFVVGPGAAELRATSKPPRIIQCALQPCAPHVVLHRSILHGRGQRGTPQSGPAFASSWAKRPIYTAAPQLPVSTTATGAWSDMRPARTAAQSTIDARA